ncbi:MAG: HAD family phosphatase [Spirochaetes bacterium]|nr:HAD family phosphatase [Spirochaetota bacterium]
MIKNIVFDIGNVLVSFQPEKYLKTIFSDEKLKEQIYQLIFKQEEWVELDKGTLLLEQARQSYIKKRPELTDYINRVIDGLFEKLLTPIPENIALMKELKIQGYGIYLLSNYHLEAFDYINNKFKLTEHTDGKVISAHVQLLKPDYAIYHYLLKKNSLIPEETLFIDDTLKNIEAAGELGIQGIHYLDHKSLISELDKREITISN